MLKGLGQLASLMRSASGLSGKLDETTRKLQEKRVVGTAGGDMVQVEMNGLAQVTRISIDPALFESGDREMVETLLCAAINQASGKAKEQHLEVMRELTGGLEIPGLERMMSQFTGELNPDSEPR